MSQVGWGKNLNDKTDNETKKEAVELLDKVAGKTGVPSIPYNIVKEHLDSVGQAYENAAEALDEIAKRIETGRPPDKEKIKKAEEVGQTLGRGWRKALRLLKKLT